MGKKLYVGNLSYSVNDSSLQQAFSEFGSVQSAKVMTDRDSARSKGFGFVEMSSDAEAQAAIAGMNGQNFDGRDAVVNEARPMEPRTGGGGTQRRPRHPRGRPTRLPLGALGWGREGPPARQPSPPRGAVRARPEGPLERFVRRRSGRSG